MKEIFCKSGNIIASLPNEAWEEPESGVAIVPCTGCAHKFHQEQLKYIAGEEETAKETKLVTITVNEHIVRVITNLERLNKEVVLCTCNCAIRYPNYGST